MQNLIRANICFEYYLKMTFMLSGKNPWGLVWLRLKLMMTSYWKLAQFKSWWRDIEHSQSRVHTGFSSKMNSSCWNWTRWWIVRCAYLYQQRLRSSCVLIDTTYVVNTQLSVSLALFVRNQWVKTSTSWLSLSLTPWTIPVLIMAARRRCTFQIWTCIRLGESWESHWYTHEHSHWWIEGKIPRRCIQISQAIRRNLK